MCCLFGYYNYSEEEIKNITNLTNILSEYAAERGMDATGIAYCKNNRLTVHKEAKPAYQVNFKHPLNTVCVMGHTRHSTQGSEKKNFNNHPFIGTCKNLKFALAHNGVLINDDELKRTYNLPTNKIETDSYVAVQLIEKKKELTVDTVKFMAENVKGSFSFTLLDSSNTLWLVKGDSPLTIVHLPKYKLYVYASTEEILYKSLVDTEFFAEIKNGNFSECDINCGDILRITKNGDLLLNKFKYNEYHGYCNWWDFDTHSTPLSYIDDLKSVASHYGYSPDTIDELLENGFTTDEIEEYIYCIE